MLQWLKKVKPKLQNVCHNSSYETAKKPSIAEKSSFSGLFPHVSFGFYATMDE